MKMAKKKTVKNTVKKPQDLFKDWWEKVGSKKTLKIEKKWIKENEPNDPEEEEGGDHWCVNQMMHDGDAFNMTYDEAEAAFIQGCNKEELDFNGLYCELDDVVNEAYEAGKKHSK